MRRRRFSQGDVGLMREMFALGATWQQIGERLGRNQSSIRQKAYTLGLARYEAGNKPKAVVSSNTMKNRRYQLKRPEARKAHKAVEWALISGSIERAPCEVCGAGNVEAHHDDYARPLDVRWLCRAHHAERHRSQVAA